MNNFNTEEDDASMEEQELMLDWVLERISLHNSQQTLDTIEAVEAVEMDGTGENPSNEVSNSQDPNTEEMTSAEYIQNKMKDTISDEGKENEKKSVDDDLFGDSLSNDDCKEEVEVHVQKAHAITSLFHAVEALKGQEEDSKERTTEGHSNPAAYTGSIS